jgi:hypothetical protein
MDRGRHQIGMNSTQVVDLIRELSFAKDSTLVCNDAPHFSKLQQGLPSARILRRLYGSDTLGHLLLEIRVHPHPLTVNAG